MLYYTHADGVYLVHLIETGELIDQFNSLEALLEIYPDIKEW